MTNFDGDPGRNGTAEHAAFSSGPAGRTPELNSDTPVVVSQPASDRSTRLAETPLAVVVSFPRDTQIASGEKENKDAQRRALTERATHLGSVTGAYHREEPIIWGWTRNDANGPITITTSLIPPDSDDTPPAASAPDDRATEQDGRDLRPGAPIPMPDPTFFSENESDSHEDTSEQPAVEATTLTPAKKKSYGLWPPGTKIDRMTREAAAKRNEGFGPWKRIEMRFTGLDKSDTPLAKMAADSGVPPSLTLDTTLLNSYPGAFRFDCVALPHAEEDVREQLSSAHGDKNGAEGKKGTSSRAAQLAKKLGVLVDELDRDVDQGRFTPGFVVSTRNPQDLERVAGMIRDAGDTELPYAGQTNPNTYATWLDAVLDRPIEPALRPILEPEEQIFVEAGISAEMVTRWMPKPVRPIDGVGNHSREPYDVEIEGAKDIPPGERVAIGFTEDVNGDETTQPIVMGIKEMASGVGVWGTTGAGKSVALREIAVGAATLEKPVPVVFVNPKKPDPRKPRNAQILAAMLEPHGVTVTEIVAGSMNPEDEIVGMNPLDWGDSDPSEYVKGLVPVCANAYGPQAGKDNPDAAELTMRYWTTALLGKRGEFDGIYKRFGWDPETGQPLIPGTNPPKPTLWDLPDILQEAADFQGYKGDARDVGPFLKDRTIALTRSAGGRFFGGAPIDTRKLFSAGESGRDLVKEIDISGLDERERTLVMGIIMLHSNAYLAKYGGPLVTMYDEANEVVTDGPMGERVGQIVATTRERDGITVLAGQNPELIPARVRNNLATHVGMLLKDKESQEAIQGQLGQTDAQSAEMVSYEAGDVVLMKNGMDRPVRGKVRMTRVDARNAELAPPRVLTNVDGREKLPSGDQIHERTKLLDQTPVGWKVTGVVEEIIKTRLLGLGAVAINFPANRANGVTEYDELKAMDPEDRREIIKMAATRQVNSRAKKVVRKGFDREAFITHCMDQAEAALVDDRTKLVKGTDAGFTLDEFATIGIKGKLFAAIGDQIDAGRAQDALPPLDEQTLGAAVPGANAFDQLTYINRQQRPTRPVILVTNPYFGGIYIDRPVASVKPDIEASVKKAVEGDEEADWEKGYSNFVWELDFVDDGPTQRSPTREYLFNETHNLVAAEAKKRDKARNVTKPEGLPPAVVQSLTTTNEAILYLLQQQRQPNTGAAGPN